MAARRCSDCLINFPFTGGFLRCRGCGHSTEPIRNATPDDDWKDLANEVRLRLEEAARKSDGVVELNVQVADRNGHAFISSHDVCRTGYVSFLRPDTILKINEALYEVIGYSETRREYWLAPINLDAREDLHVEATNDVFV